jgi:hypothetical protein
LGVDVQIEAIRDLDASLLSSLILYNVGPCRG